MVSETQRNRVCGYLEAGKQEGAPAIAGGKAREGSGYFIEPTVFVDTRPNMKIVREEIFGPVVTAMPFTEMDEDLVREANDSIYGLAAGIWTRDLSKAHALAAQLKAGSVWVNCYNIFDAALPFGGYRAVRLGARNGRSGTGQLPQHQSRHRSDCSFKSMGGRNVCGGRSNHWRRSSN